MIPFFIGIFIGAWIGIIIVSLMVVGKRGVYEDNRINEN